MKDNVKQLQELIQSQRQQKQQPPVENKHIVTNKDISQDAIADPVLQVIHDEKLLFKTTNINYYILGKLPPDFSSMQVTLLAAEETSDKRERYKIDLYEYNQVRQAVRAIASLFFINEEIIEADFRVLVNLVEQYRDTQVVQEYHQTSFRRHVMQSTQQSAAVEFLTSEYLMPATELLLEKAGIKGQKSIKLLTYLLAASYKSANPLHLGIEGSPG